jgi:hypothetical protein
MSFYVILMGMSWGVGNIGGMLRGESTLGKIIGE